MDFDETAADLRRPLGSGLRGLVAGEVEVIENGEARGWLFCPLGDARPSLFVGGRAAELISWREDRQDIAQAMRIDPAVGFRFKLPGADPGDDVELHAVVKGKLHSISSSKMPHGVLESSFMHQIRAAAEIAKSRDAVAIVCWDSRHNPIGRAKVLYDVVRTRRPAVLFAYAFDEFGSETWAPLRDSNISMVTIPWKSRHLYHRALADLGFAFQTVWMCKPRYPTFVLAAQLAHKEAKLILDFDDNEEHFSMSKASTTKPYGLPGIGISRALTSAVRARTVASVSLQAEFGGEVVRHARTASGVARGEREPGPFRVGFVGTVRPHKNLEYAAQAISLAKWQMGIDVELHVAGDVSPPELRSKLEEMGVVVGGSVPMVQLPNVIRSMDCLLTGFPGTDPSQHEITRFQISSKIGDGLAEGIPVLVPESESVEDLRGVPGVHLFGEENFVDVLAGALRAGGTPRLPAEFTFDGAYEAFEAAEAAASAAPRAGAVLADRRAPELTVAAQAVLPRTILLVWKQFDAGLYGRRVDQIARACKRANPGDRVVVLELASEAQRASLGVRAKNHLSDAGHVLDLMRIKSSSGHIDATGVEYRCINLVNDSSSASQLELFLFEQEMLPTNTTVVLFPLVPSYERIQNVLHAYPTVVDVVDNQLSWATTKEAADKFSAEYHACLRQADALVFNSANNMEEFARSYGSLVHSAGRVIPNWYMQPGDLSLSGPGKFDEAPQVVYSGNMSDRVKWGLLFKVADMPMRPTVHLIGAAERTPEMPLRRALTHPRIVYHGPQNEEATLAFLASMDVAIMPHHVDDHSMYMNPLKVEMYRSLGLPVVATAVPGLDTSNPCLSVVEGGDGAFVKLVGQLASERAKARDKGPRALGGSLRVPKTLSRRSEIPKGALEYVALIDSISARRA